MTIPIPDMKDDNALSEWMENNLGSGVYWHVEREAIRALVREVARKVAEETLRLVDVDDTDAIPYALDAILGPAPKEV